MLGAAAGSAGVVHTPWLLPPNHCYTSPVLQPYRTGLCPLGGQGWHASSIEEAPYTTPYDTTYIGCFFHWCLLVVVQWARGTVMAAAAAGCWLPGSGLNTGPLSVADT